MSDLPKKISDSLICSFLVNDLSNSLTIAHFLWATLANRSSHFWWATWAICLHRSFDLSEMSDSLTLLTKKEEMSENEPFPNFLNKFFSKSYIKHTKNKILDFLGQHFLSESLICSFPLATWANRSWLLICLERPERFAHGRSFPLSDLSDSLTVAHLSWTIWAKSSQSLILFERNELMREFPALWFRSIVCLTHFVPIFYTLR